MSPPWTSPSAERRALRAYGWLMRLLWPLVLWRLWWRGRAEPLYRAHLGERLGRSVEPPTTGRVWVHAVSLGETRAAAPLIEALRRARPGLAVLLTHGTATGRAAGQALLQAGDAQAWLPWDSPGAVARFLAAHRPAVGVLMETEVWPSLLAQARQEQVPMLLANARLSPKSLRQARRFPSLLRPAVAGLAAVLAQSEADAQRLREAGARRVTVRGNLKFDMTPDTALLARGRAWRQALGRPVVLAASTREGEEAGLLQAWAAAPEAMDPPPLLLIVPRHPQRFDEVAALCTAAGHRLARRSAWPDARAPDAAARQATVWLGDSLGELPLYYALADVALLGGSFAPFGGQNLIEAAACGCPLVMGPSTYNFSDAAALAVAAGAATAVADLPAALDEALALLRDPRQRRRRAEAAEAFAALHRGAAVHMADDILARMPTAVR